MYTTPTLRATMTTAHAAKALNRAQQTLRNWASLENGPIRPIHINGRLAWPADEIAALVAGKGDTATTCPHCGAARSGGAH